MMHAAVINNCPNFVRLLLEHGVSLRALYTDAKLLKLYKHVRLKLFCML